MKLIISGGGTGGHIFPALAIANAIKELKPDTDILFVGAKGRMEMEKVPAAGYPIEGLWISGIQRRLTFSNLMFPFKLISSLNKAKQIIRSFRPDVVIGTGGYASGPLLQVASSKGIPCLIQEQNSFPGITNKLLAKKVDRICVAHQGMEKYFPKDKIRITGNPVRKDILNVEKKREEAVKFFGLDPAKKTLLVIGGSLGARTINESIAASLSLLDQNNIQLIWQTGKSFNAPTVKGWSGAFIDRMDLAYAAADAAISRAGALSLSELALVKMPVILVPSPNVAEDHQTKNAMALVNNQAAWICRDADARNELGKMIVQLMGDEQTKSQLKGNIEKLSFPEAAATIAKEVIELAGK